MSTTLPDALLRDLSPHHPRSLSGIALRAFLLGAALSLATALALTAALHPAGILAPLPARVAAAWRPPFFLAALAAFHFLEFYTTARAHPAAATTSAFLLSANGRAYNAAHALAFLEATCTSLLAPRWLAAVSPAPARVLGVAAMLLGQAVRSAAMLTAGRSFNHTVQTRRRDGHVLVTRGVYRGLRHPAYCGFFWWAVGGQLAMGNVVCGVGFFVVLAAFFGRRIEREEAYLVGFFGEEYEAYRRRTWVGVPLAGWFGRGHARVE